MPGKRRLVHCFVVTGMVVSLFMSPDLLYGQTSEYLLKAGFMERFTRFIEWPPGSSQSDPAQPFRMLIIGKNPFDKNLEILFEETPIKGRKVEIFYATKLDTSQQFHMIFIASGMAKELSSILDYTHDKPILTVSDTKGFGSQGVLINFYVEENKIRFEINQEAVKKGGLRISHLLLNMARII